MNPETRQILNNLNTAEAALRSNLHLHLLDETVRHHMERALAHVREAWIAANAPGRARSVSSLLHDLDVGERLLALAAAKADREEQQ